MLMCLRYFTDQNDTFTVKACNNTHRSVNEILTALIKDIL